MRQVGKTPHAKSACSGTRVSALSKENDYSMKLKIPEGKFGAYLFDCDGTVVDSMPLHYRAWKKALSERNCEFSEELFYQWGGMPVAEVVATLNRERGLQMPVDEMEHRKESLYYELLPELKAIPEVLEHIEAEKGHSFRGGVGKHSGICDCVAECGETVGSV